jgi:uncharacterized membrane protein
LPSHRKLWLDWQRGVAVLFMIEVHVLDAWLSRAAPRSGAYALLLMVGGFAAPGFLYMAGLSQALADAAQERRGVAAADRRRGALRRAVWLLGVAYGFRLAEFVLGGAWRRPDGWQDLLKVDILNVIAVGLLLGAVLSVGRTRRTGALLAGAAALAVALATPPIAAVLRHYDLPAGGGAPAAIAPGRAVDLAYAYLYASWPRANFSLFNWVAFLLAGVAVAPLALGERRPLRWLGLGAGLLALGWLADRGPDVFAYQQFWRTSPAWLAMRLGVCAGLTGLLQLVPDAAERPLAWLSTLGRQSLVAYLASVELTYGVLVDAFAVRLAGAPLRRALSFGATVTGMVAMVAVTWAIAAGWERLQAWRKARARSAAAAAAAA